jgi:hypothetical protein
MRRHVVGCRVQKIKKQKALDLFKKIKGSGTHGTSEDAVEPGHMWSIIT